MTDAQTVPADDVMAGTARRPAPDDTIPLDEVLPASTVDALRARRAETTVDQPDGDADRLTPDDEVRLLPAGKVSMVLAGQRYLLNPPTNRQLYDIRNALSEALTAARDRAAAQAEVQAAAAAEVKAGTTSLGTVDRLLEEIRPKAEDDASEDALYGVMAMAVQRLSSRRLPPRAECPVWLTQVSLPVQLIRHWRSVPLVPGR